LVVDDADVNIKKKYIPCDYPFLIEDSHVGDLIKIDSGLLTVKVIGKSKNFLEVRALRTAEIIEKRHVNLPGIKLRLPAISAKDKKDLAFAAKYDFDYVALSFVGSEQDILEVRALLDTAAKPGIKIVSKVENLSAIADLDDIVAYSDMVMVARGDL
jgi:pyruvate kinase